MILVLVATSCGIAKADHPAIGIGSGIAGPAMTIPAATLRKGKGAISLQVEFVELSPFSDVEFAQFAPQDSGAHNVYYLLTPSVGIGYGVTDDLTSGLRIPYLLRSDIREGHVEGGEAEIHLHGNSGDIGDLSLLGQYRFLNHPPLNLECALLAGIKMPSGATHVTDKNGAQF